jgi:hypothetical protein
MSRAKVRVYKHGVQLMNVCPTSIPDLDILLDTPEWFEWLDSQTQFKYCGNLTEMSVKRRPNGKWYARKKILSSNGSKPIDLYIGSDEECTSDKLKEVNHHFGKNNSEFWNWYYDPARKGDKPKGVQSDSVYTLAQVTSESGEDVAKLQARINELELKLSSTEKKLERESGDAQRYYVRWRKYPDLERQFKRNEQKLREAESAIAKLEHRLNQSALPREALRLIRKAVTAPNGTVKGAKGYQNKSFTQGVDDIRQALALLEQHQSVIALEPDEVSRKDLT